MKTKQTKSIDEDHETMLKASEKAWADLELHSFI